MMVPDPNRPNIRGTAARSQDRNERYATHLPVLRACIASLSASIRDPISIVEHGMGLGSTPYFHSLAHVDQFTSFEREPEWLECANCASGSTGHLVIHVHDDLTAINVNIARPDRTLGLVDGYASQRPHVLDAWMRQGVALIVEHDADTFDSKGVGRRQVLAQTYGYRAFQYVGLNPETAIYVGSNAPPLPITGSCLAL